MDYLEKRLDGGWAALSRKKNSTITIKSTVTECVVDGKRADIARDTTKTKKSFRTLPMVPAVEKELLAIKKAKRR